METRTELCGINKIIDSIDQEQPNLNPTQIYNEGWMTRLLVKFSIEDKLNADSTRKRNFALFGLNFCFLA